LVEEVVVARGDLPERAGGYYHEIMTYSHENKSTAKRVAEPVQVYLESTDQDRLERLADQLRTSKSAVLRRGLEALERQLTDTDAHPALRIIGIADGEIGPPVRYDIAREHDRYLADLEDQRIRGAGAAKPRRRKRGG
jgi:predicted transcriptional regulator